MATVRARNLLRPDTLGLTSAPQNGATKIPLTGGTWSAFPVRAQSNIDANAAPPNTEHGSGTGVRMWVNPADLAGWDIGGRFELTTPVEVNDNNFSFLVYLKEFPGSTGNSAWLNLRIRLSIDAGAGTFTNYIEFNAKVPAGRWSLLSFGGIVDTAITSGERVGATVAGTIASGSTFKRIELLTGSMTGIAPEIFLKQVTYGGNSPAVVIFSGDDAYQSFADTTYPVFAEYGLRTTFNLISGSAVGVGAPTRMSLATVKGLSKSVVSWGHHSESHFSYSLVQSLTQEQIRVDLQNCLNWGLDNDLNDSDDSFYHVAWPYGADGRDDVRSKIIGAAEQVGLRSIRGTVPGTDGYGRADVYHGLCTFLDVTQANAAPKFILARINQLMAGPGGVFRIGYHNIGPGSGSTDYPEASFRQIVHKVAKLRDAGRLLVLTEAEYQKAANLSTISI